VVLTEKGGGGVIKLPGHGTEGGKDGLGHCVARRGLSRFLWSSKGVRGCGWVPGAQDEKIKGYAIRRRTNPEETQSKVVLGGISTCLGTFHTYKINGGAYRNYIMKVPVISLKGTKSR